MKKLLLFIFLILVFYSLSWADTNLINLTSTVHKYVGGGGGGGSFSHDDDFSTAYYDGVDSSGSGGSCSYSISSEHIFSTIHNITKLKFRLLASAGTYGDSSAHHGGYHLYYTLDGSTWLEITDGVKMPRSFGADDDGSGSIDTAEAGQYPSSYEMTISIPDCKGIRAYVDANANSSGGDGNWWYSHAYIYEIQAFGVEDIGLRVYDGSKVIRVACEPVGGETSPLRIHKNGITYSVVLVEPAHARASKIRVKTSSGIKAIAKIDQ